MPSKRAAKPPPVLRFELRYCDQLVEFMAQGYSLTAFAGEIGTSRAKLMRWREEHPPFAKALECGQARRARLLEQRLLETGGIKAVDVNMQALKTAAPDEWSPPPGKAAVRKAARPDGGDVEKVSFAAPDNGRD